MRCNWPIVRMPSRFERCREGLADAPDQRHRLRGEERRRLGLADHRKAARLRHVGRDLGEELAIGQPDRNGDADLPLDVAWRTARAPAPAASVQPLGAGEVEERLVDRERLDQRRQRLHHRAHLAADADIFFHVRRDDDRLGAGFERLEHRHRRAHALDAGDVAGGRDDAALAAADDHRLVLQFRIVALFDRRIEGVAVDMGEMQPVELGMADQPRAAAAPRNARPGRRCSGQAVAAETVLRIVDRRRPWMRT